VVYSTVDALQIAQKNPDKRVVFLGVGFETTAPTIAAAIYSADQMQVGNFSVICAHKVVPPALEALMAAEHVNIDGFILPGHVSVIIGEKAYLPFSKRHQIPCVIAGFEPSCRPSACWSNRLKAGIRVLKMPISAPLPSKGTPKPRKCWMMFSKRSTPAGVPSA
jgi:hydrogenase expression/formation protein HypD